jgi:hypothetical protein
MTPGAGIESDDETQVGGLNFRQNWNAIWNSIK